jgi:hypothetical protein
MEQCLRRQAPDSSKRRQVKEQSALLLPKGQGEGEAGL